MSVSWEREASESLAQSRHIRGPLLSYLLAPGTGNLHFEEVVTRVLQENWEEHERAKERFWSSLNSSHHQQSKLSGELNELSQVMEATADRKVHEETKARMGILRTTLKKVEALMAQSEDHLEESWMREEEAHQEDWGQSNFSEGQDRDIMVEEAEGSGPTGVEATGPPRSQEVEPSMEVDMDDIPPLTSNDATTVTAEEDKMLTMMAISPRMAKPHSRSRPPQCVREALHMSPLHHLRRRKKEDPDARIREKSRVWRQDQAVSMHYYTRSLNWGGEGQFVCP